ncbi:MAG: MFS transporter [Bryobacteraceae bacterium]|nr:MFS transporter [Bryobacteraceae bacterium]
MTFTRPQWFIALLLFSMILLNYLDRVVLSLLSPVIRAEFQLTSMNYAMAVNAFLLAYGVMYVGSGILLDRLGSRRGLGLFVGLWSLACMLHAAIIGFYSLAAYRFLLGVFEPGGWTGAVKTVSERFAPAQRSLAAGIFTSGAGLGSVIAPPLVVWLSLHYGWRSAFLLAGLAGLLWLPLWWLATREQPAVARAPLRLALLREPGALAYVATRFFGDTTGYFFLFWLPEYLMTSKGFTLTQVGALAWIPFLWNDLGALAGGYISGKFVEQGRRPLQARKLMMSVAPLFVLTGSALQAASGTLGVLLSVSLCTFGVGIWAANMHAVPADGFAPGEVATVHGLAGSAGALGGILFNTLVGYYSASGNYLVVFLVLVLLQPFGVAALWLWLPERRLE